MSKRKFLWCEHCQKQTWARPLARAYSYFCETCNRDINIVIAKKKIAKERKAARAAKAKADGTYQSPALKKKKRQERRRGEADPDYIAWIKEMPCLVCSTRKEASDAHHAVHRSQGGSDRTAVPLCRFHHIEVYHRQLGSADAAMKEWGLDLLSIAEALSEQYEALRRSSAEPPPSPCL